MCLLSHFCFAALLWRSGRYYGATACPEPCPNHGGDLEASESLTQELLDSLSFVQLFSLNSIQAGVASTATTAAVHVGNEVGNVISKEMQDNAMGSSNLLLSSGFVKFMKIHEGMSTKNSEDTAVLLFSLLLFMVLVVIVSVFVACTMPTPYRDSIAPVKRWPPLHTGAGEPELIACSARNIGSHPEAPYVMRTEAVKMLQKHGKPWNSMDSLWPTDPLSVPFTFQILSLTYEPAFDITLHAGKNGSRVLVLSELGVNGKVLMSMTSSLEINDEEGQRFGHMQQQGHSNVVYVRNHMTHRADNRYIGWLSQPEKAIMRMTTDGHQHFLFTTVLASSSTVTSKEQGRNLAIISPVKQKDGSTNLEFVIREGVDNPLVLLCFLGVIAFETPSEGSVAAIFGPQPEADVPPEATVNHMGPFAPAQEHYEAYD